MLSRKIVFGSTLLFCLGTATVAASGPTKQEIAGDYSGTLGPLHLRLRLKLDALGTLSGTMDSPDQGSLVVVAGCLPVSRGCDALYWFRNSRS
jgi:hypothetical protein